MSHRPTISIIVPVYNMEQYLKECLDSALRQTFTDFELIAVDDKSTDNSLSILREYATHDPRIKIIEHDVNKNVGMTRNTGLKSASGRYFLFIDPDDYYHTDDALQILMDTATSTNACIVQFPFLRLIDNKFEPRYTPRYYEYVGKDILQSFQEYDVAVSKSFSWDKMYKAELFVANNITFPTGLMEDQVATTQLLYYAQKIVLIAQPLIVYRIRPDSLMRKAYTREELRGVVVNTFMIFDFLTSKGNDGEYDSVLKVHTLSYALHLQMALEHINESPEAQLKILADIAAITSPHKALLDHLFDYTSPDSWHFHAMRIIGKTPNIDRKVADYVYNLHNVSRKSYRRSYGFYMALSKSQITRPIALAYREIFITPKRIKLIKYMGFR